MKRRDFVKGLAAAPTAIMVGRTKGEGHIDSFVQINKAAVSHDSNVQQLNVLVHGTFVISIDRKAAPPQIYLRAPYVDDHQYQAQTFTVDPNNPQGVSDGWKQGDYIAKRNANDTVVFDRGPSIKLHINIGEGPRLAIDSSNKKDGDSPYWTIALPLPDDIWPFRATPYNYFDRTGVPTDTYHANEMFFEQTVPLIYVLTYNQIKAGNKVTFSGNNMDVPFENGIGRLHFYAEPVMPNCEGGNPGHLRKALNALNGLFNPRLTLKLASSSDPDQPQGFDSAGDVCFKSHPSVLQCEERSLEERACIPCTAIQSKPSIGAQYAAAEKFIADLKSLKEELTFPLEQESLTLSERKKTVEVKWKPRNVTVPGLKPPSNCMALIALKS